MVTSDPDLLAQIKATLNEQGASLELRQDEERLRGRTGNPGS